MVTFEEALPFTIPLTAFITSIITSALVIRAFRNKPWNIKQWLIVFIAGWIPWSGFTVWMRLTPDHDSALWFLRLSFISLQILSYANYKFHHMLLFQDKQNRFASFGMAIIVGFNTFASFNPQMLEVQRTTSGLYWVDQFSTQLLISNLVLNIWSGYWAIMALRKMDLFSTFYNPDGTRRVFLIGTTFVLVFSLPILLAIWILEQNSEVSPDVTLFIIMAVFIMAFLGYTYGLRPISSILTPQRLWSFVVINNAGLPLYERHFSGNEKLGELTLFSGALSVINVIIKQELKSKSSLERVSLADRAVMIREYDDNLLCIIADHHSIQLDNVLDVILEHVHSFPAVIENIEDSPALMDGILDDLLVIKEVRR